MKTKNYEIYLAGHISWRYLWTFLFSIELEHFQKGYFELNLHVLCFGVAFTAVSEKFSAEIDNMLQEMRGEQNNG